MTFKHQVHCVILKEIAGQKVLTHICGKNQKGEMWNIGIEQAASGIATGMWEFFIVHDSKHIPLEFAQTEIGISLTTSGTPQNLLLELTPCNIL
ncbi:hypothetical protein D0X99_10965 [Algoriphagus lacus]|uniref:DUF3892 domain-containing protein n=1 Tax=Algoriphagus lacus TaxID=2056311 RepID=A0A418PQV7_9BACT|nr:hypothetical protein [Algoriphagus lacus]RIW14971.1 hypothetical protein D0X99_10965 [Algoriphagus lacus]